MRECYIRLTRKGSPRINTPAYWSHLCATKKMKCCEYGQFAALYFLCNVQIHPESSVLHYAMLERPRQTLKLDEHSSLLSQFVSYKENEVT